MEYKYEIPWCQECRDWHGPGPHTRRVQYTNTSSTNANASSSWSASWGKAPVDVMLKAALRVIGVSEHATIKEVRKAFRERMMQVHPDHGGDSDEAKRVIAARDVLRSRKRI